MATTRVVLSLLAMVLLTAGSVALYRDRDYAGAWLMVFGFATASVWGLMSIVLSTRGRAGVPRDATAALTSVAIVLTLFYLHRAVTREPIL